MPDQSTAATVGTASPRDHRVVVLEGIRKSYGPRTVLDGIDIAVRPGEKVSLIGPSGSGKTTILRLVMGLEKPDAGTIRIDGGYLWHQMRKGELVPAGESHAREIRRGVGMVFQQFNLFPHMTALQNVAEPAQKVLHLRRDDAVARAEDLLRRVGLQEHARKRPDQLSGGQQQRVAIARSMALRPRVMLLDEITSALDPELVGEVLNVVRSLASESNTAMLIVTHEMRFAADISDRVLMFDAGRIIEEGPPSQVFKAPVHARTRQFLNAVLER